MSNTAILGVHYGKDATDMVDIEVDVECLGCKNNLIIVTPWHKNKPFDVTCARCDKRQIVYPEHRELTIEEQGQA